MSYNVGGVDMEQSQRIRISAFFDLLEKWSRTEDAAFYDEALEEVRYFVPGMRPPWWNLFGTLGGLCGGRRGVFPFT